MQAGGQSSRFIGFATAGAVAYAIAFPLLALSRIATDGIDQDATVYAVIATACVVPFQGWLVFAGTRGRISEWSIGVFAALIIAGLPVIGTGWIGALYGLAAVILVGVRPPWSLVLYVALMAAPAPLAYAFGHPEYGLYFTLGLPLLSVPVAVAVWLIRTARQLQAARRQLADDAVIRERLQIDAELRQTIGTALEQIAQRGDLLGGLIGTDPHAALAGLRALVGAARGTLADARRIVTRYQRVSLRYELRAAVALLSAAGIRARLVLPPGDLPDTLDPVQRAALRHDLARVLRDDTPVTSVTIAVIARGGRLGTELRWDDAAARNQTAAR